jgi:hypothetical protein
MWLGDDKTSKVIFSHQRNGIEFCPRQYVIEMVSCGIYWTWFAGYVNCKIMEVIIVIHECCLHGIYSCKA